MKSFKLKLIPLCLFTIVIFLCSTIVTGQQKDEIKFDKGLAAKIIGEYGRSPVHSDLLEFQLMNGSLETPEDGNLFGVTDTEEEIFWTEVKVDEKGWFRSASLRGGYLYLSTTLPEEKVIILEAAGNSSLFINGIPRGGDVYGFGWTKHPVRLKKGRNDFFFRTMRGRVRIKITEPDKAIIFTDQDKTLPDLIKGEEDNVWGAVRIVNSTQNITGNLVISCEVNNGEKILTDVPVIGQFTSRKVGFRIKPGLINNSEKAKVFLTLFESSGNTKK